MSPGTSQVIVDVSAHSTDEVVTAVEGGCDVLDPDTGRRIDERTRLAALVAA